MRVLITGAAGFLGSALARAHLRDGDVVYALRHRRPLPVDLIGRVDALEGDVREALRRPWPTVEVIYHCAALMADQEQVCYADFYQLNVEGTSRLLQAAKALRVRRFVHVSSAGVLGPTRGVAVESAPYGAHLTKYEQSKRESERVAQAAYREGVPVTIVRPTQLYGPGMQHVWPRLMDQVRGGHVPVLGGGLARVHFTHVDDVVRGMRLAAITSRAVGEIYHLAAEAPVTVRHMLESLAARLGAPSPRTLPYWPVHAMAVALQWWPQALRPEVLRLLTVHNVEFFVRDRVYSIDKAKRELGYTPLVTWDDGMVATVGWYKAHGLEPTAVRRPLAHHRLRRCV